MVDNVLTLVCVSENSGAEISHLMAPTSQTDTNVCTQYPNSFSIDPARSIHQNTTATLYPQAQVTRFAAYHPWQPSNNYSQTSPSSLLRVTHYGCYTQHPQSPLVQVPFSPVLYPSHPHSSVEQNLPTSQARFARFESAHHGQLHPSSIRTAACDPQGASFTHSHLPSTFAGALHPMPCSTTSGPFPMFPLPWNGVRNLNMPFHRVAFPENRNISTPTQADANWSSTFQVDSRNVRYVSPHPAIQPLEDKLRGTTGETA